MQIVKTNFEGLFIIEANLLEDSRGRFTRLYCEKEFKKLELATSWVQINTSFNLTKGTVRGMHYQCYPSKEIKMIKCIQGKIHDVVIDIRPNSKTYLQHFKIELSANENIALYVPAGFAHGFQTLEDNSIIIYHHSDFYDKTLDCALNFQDPSLKIKFPLPVNIISDRDSTHPFINEHFFGYTN